jgi:ABC-type nitrate/sulfonate/bicarbonate transport system substrate-binding protein
MIGSPTKGSTTRVSRRDFLKTASVTVGALAAGTAVGARPRPAAAQGVKGKVRFAYLQLGWAACEIIHKEDLLGKRGWQAEYSVVAGSPTGLVNTFAAGNVDAIDMSFALAAKMFEDKVPVRVTGVATAVLGAIVARRDSGITKVEDLKGRKIAAVVGTTAFFDIRALTLKAYGFDVQKDTQLITAQAPPDMATLIAKKDVDAIIAWQPVSDLVVHRGDGVYLAKQIDLWRKATGRAAGYPVHVCYAVNPSFIEKNPAFPKDLNDAQREAVDVWYNNKTRAVEIVAEITKIPRDVVEYAYGQTVQMLSGLSDEQVDSLVVQLKLIKEFGFLKSDIWDNPDRIKKEFLWRG